jgi:hypothetical protein
MWSAREEEEIKKQEVLEKKRERDICYQKV